MIVFPNAKINLGLSVTEKRTDGFHNLETVFYPAPWCDALEIIPSDQFEFNQTGFDIQTSADDNLCVKVYRDLQKDFNLPAIKMHLHKVIPSGAGLGGGSSDAAFCIKLLNELFELNLSAAQMEERVKKFGSDCAFFIQNQPVFATGKGDEFHNIELTLKGKFLVLIFPGFPVPTKEAYSGITPEKPVRSVREITGLPIENWRDLLKNDFEKSIFPKHPELDKIKNELYANGAIYASMSGSGSAMFGIFSKEPDLNFVKNHYKIWKGFL